MASFVFLLHVCPLLAHYHPTAGSHLPISDICEDYDRLNNIGHGCNAEERKVRHGVKVIDGVEVKMIGALMSIIPKIKISFASDPQDVYT